MTPLPFVSGKSGVGALICPASACEINAAGCGKRERIAVAAVGQEVRRHHLDQSVRIADNLARRHHAVRYPPAVINDGERLNTLADRRRRVKAESHPADLREPSGLQLSNAGKADAVLHNLPQLQRR